MSESVRKKPQAPDWRGLTSLTVAVAFLAIVVTGLVLYAAPQGRVANWTAWSVLGLRREQWTAVHTTASLLFILASLLHVYFNWRPLLRYVAAKRSLWPKRETLVALAVVAVVFAGTVLDVPPFSSVGALNGRIKSYWEGQSAQAPYPHAEISTLADFARRTGAEVAALTQRLAMAGIVVADPESQTILGLARAHGLSPSDLFARVAVAPGAAGHEPGLGRQTLRAWSQGDAGALESALRLLKERGFDAQPESTFRDLAGQKNVSPAEVRDLLAASGGHTP